MLFRKFKKLFDQSKFKDEILDDMVDVAKSLEATAINNQGKDAQLTFLIQTHGQEALADYFELDLDIKPTS